MQQNIQQLGGHCLDYAVHLALGHAAEGFVPDLSASYLDSPLHVVAIIHQFNIGCVPVMDELNLWEAKIYLAANEAINAQRGSNLIEASMRAFVSHELGVSVDVPERIMEAEDARKVAVLISRSAVTESKLESKPEYSIWSRHLTVDGFPIHIAGTVDEGHSVFFYTRCDHLPAIQALISLTEKEFLQPVDIHSPTTLFFEVSDDGDELICHEMKPTSTQDGLFNGFVECGEYELEGSEVEMDLIQALYAEEQLPHDVTLN